MKLKHALLMASFLSVAAPAFADEYVIMKLNGQDVSSSEVQQLWEGLFPQGQAPSFDTVKPDMRERILRAVMAEKLIYGEALKQGVDKSPKMLAEFESVKRKIIVRAFLDGKGANLISDADVKREYDAMLAATSKEDTREVRARHILVPTEQEAKDIKKKLDSGKSFDDLAKDFSKDPGSAAKGGDLGYFTKDKMVKEFADVAFSMKKGEVSGPVKSSFGYHIIKVEDSRKVSPPTLSEVKDEIRAKLQEKKLNDYIGGLVKSANVKTFDAKGKEVPFTKNLPSQAESGPVAKPVEPEPEPEQKPAASIDKSAKADAKADKSH